MSYLASLYQAKADYFALRAERPNLSARLAWAFVNSDGSEPLPEFVCNRTRGHKWAFTGSAYGGDDERFHGEGRSYCIHCGADGDA